MASNTTKWNSEGPGIEGFQIIGDATPGEKLLGCGYPVRGTTLCMFQVKLFGSFSHDYFFLRSFSLLYVRTNLSYVNDMDM